MATGNAAAQPYVSRPAVETYPWTATKGYVSQHSQRNLPRSDEPEIDATRVE